MVFLFYIIKYHFIHFELVYVYYNTTKHKSKKKNNFFHTNMYILCDIFYYFRLKIV